MRECWQARLLAPAADEIGNVTPATAPERRWLIPACYDGELAPDDATLFFRRAAPDARVLVGVERVLQAVGAHRAFATHVLGLLDLHERITSGADREEQLGIGVATDRAVAPRVVRSRQGKTRRRNRHVGPLTVLVTSCTWNTGGVHADCTVRTAAVRDKR